MKKRRKREDTHPTKGVNNEIKKTSIKENRKKRIRTRGKR